MPKINTNKGQIDIQGPVFETGKLLSIMVEQDEGFESQTLDLSREEAQDLHNLIGNFLDNFEEKPKLIDTLLNCGRIRVLGAAREHQDGQVGKIRHIGLELWTTFEKIDDSKDRDTLMCFLNQTSNE